MIAFFLKAEPLPSPKLWIQIAVPVDSIARQPAARSPDLQRAALSLRNHLPSPQRVRQMGKDLGRRPQDLSTHCAGRDWGVASWQQPAGAWDQSLPARLAGAARTQRPWEPGAARACAHGGGEGAGQFPAEPGAQLLSWRVCAALEP